MDTDILALTEEMERRGYSPRTRELYAMCLDVFSRRTGIPLRRCAASEIDSFILHLRRSGRGEATVRAYYEAIKHYLTFMGRRGELPHKSFRSSRRRLPVVLSQQEIARILGACRNLKIQAIIAIAYSSGLRVSEISNLDIGDIDFSRATIFVRNGKNHKDRYTVLSEKTAAIIKKYIELHNPATFIFHRDGRQNAPISPDWIHRAFKRCLVDAGINKKASLHTLRHSFATHLLENGATLFQIKELLGHESLSTTIVYLHAQSVDLSRIKSPLDLLPEKIGNFQWPMPGLQIGLFD